MLEDRREFGQIVKLWRPYVEWEGYAKEGQNSNFNLNLSGT